MRPLILMPIPVNTILSVLGILLLKSSDIADSSNLKISLRLKFLTPKISDIIIRRTRTTHNIHRFRFLHLNSTPLLLTLYSIPIIPHFFNFIYKNYKYDDKKQKKRLKREV